MAVSSLLDRYRQAVSKHKDVRMKQEAEPDIQYGTGFPSFDAINGCKIKYKLPNGQVGYRYSMGIVDGSLCMFIGRSGCGKTTFATQVACNIAAQFPTSCIYHDDIESGITDVRRAVLSGWSDDMLKDKYRIRDTGITAENFYESLSLIKDIKLANYDEYSYDTGCYDMNGNKIYKLEPTPYILDSVAMLMPEKYTEEEELSGQMSATAAAKTNAMSFKRIIPMLKAANIILILINHINQNIQMVIFPNKSSLSYLKPDETLPGGRTIGYLTNLLVRFDDNSKLKEEEGLGIAGSIVDLQIVKSRTGRAGSTISLVFDFDKGFDPDLSLYLLLKNHKKINGAGAYLYVGDNSDMKFSQKNLKQKLREDTAFAQAFMKEVVGVLQTMISDDAETKSHSFNMSNSVMNAMNEAFADQNISLVA